MSDAEIYDINTMRAVKRLSHRDKVARQFAGPGDMITWPVVPRPIPVEPPVDISMHFSSESYAAKTKAQLRNFGNIVCAHIGAFAWSELLKSELDDLEKGK